MHAAGNTGWKEGMNTPAANFNICFRVNVPASGFLYQLAGLLHHEQKLWHPRCTSQSNGMQGPQGQEDE